MFNVQHLRDSRIFCHGAFLLQWVCLQNRVKCSHANRSKWLVTHKGEEEDFSRTQRFLSTKFFLPSCLHLKKDFVISHQDAKGRGNTSLHQPINDLLQTNAQGYSELSLNLFVSWLKSGKWSATITSQLLSIWAYLKQELFFRGIRGLKRLCNLTMDWLLNKDSW